MKAWLLRFWTDPAYFAAAVRGLLGGFVLAVQMGAIDLGKAGWWACIPAFIAALGIKAGDKNVPLVEQVKGASAEELAELKAFLR